VKFNEKRYALSDMENAITNLRPGFLRVWIARGVLEVDDKAPGRGSKRFFTFKEALVIDAMAFLTLQEISSAQAVAVGKVAADAVEEFVSEGGVLDYGEIDLDEWPVLVWTYSSTNKLNHKIIKKKELSSYPSDYFQVIDYLDFAIHLKESLESVREVRIRSGK